MNFRDFGAEISQYRVQSGQSASFPGQDFYFHDSVSWSLVSSAKFGVRYYPTGFVFDIAGSSVFPNSEEKLGYLLGFLASEVAFSCLKLTNPTINFQAGDVRKLPLIYDEHSLDETNKMSQENIGRKKYVLARSLYAATGKTGVHTRHVGLDRDTNKELLLKHIRQNNEVGTPFKELQQVLPSQSRSQIQKLLRELRTAGKVISVGNTSAARWYITK